MKLWNLADSFIVSKDPEQMKAATGTIDYIIDTISADHSVLPLLGLLKLKGKLVTVGLLYDTLARGSNFGGIKETQEMLNFCGKHNITADIELIKMNQINTAMERLSKADVKYRFVIDVANLLVSSLGCFIILRKAKIGIRYYKIGKFRR
ncbi:cinnamoyl-Coa reductase [Trifolium repens]|nr:cinnamoyl-Coa reductase [Trifolium repens]